MGTARGHRACAGTGCVLRRTGDAEEAADVVAKEAREAARKTEAEEMRRKDIGAGDGTGDWRGRRLRLRSVRAPVSVNSHLHRRQLWLARTSSFMQQVSV